MASLHLVIFLSSPLDEWMSTQMGKDMEISSNGNIDDKTKGEEGQKQIKRNTGEGKHLLWCLHVSFFPRNKTKWMN